MDSRQFEARVLECLERAVRHEQVEDAHVELKGTWTDAAKSARILAAHANAAGGSPVLWIVGVDGTTGTVVGAPKDEVSTWLRQIQAEFVDLSPDLVEHLVVPNPHGPAVVGMLFDTSRAPYGVRNPKYPAAGHSRAEVEFPWRDGAGTRSARRSELIRILSGNRLPPEVEEMDAWLGVELSTLSMEEGPLEVVTWDVTASAYYTPRDDRPVTIPFHRCRVRAEFEGGFVLAFNDVRLAPEYWPSVMPSVQFSGAVSIPTPPQRKESEALLTSPSKLVLIGRVTFEAHAIPKGNVHVRAELGVSGTPTVLSVNWDLFPRAPDRHHQNEWETHER
jgi:hypothetical protein